MFFGRHNVVVNPRERVLAAIRRKPVDRIPTSFRANKVLAERLLRHFGFQEPTDFARHQADFLARLGADFWSSGTKIDRFSAFTPKYLGPPPHAPTSTTAPRSTRSGSTPVPSACPPSA